MAESSHGHVGASKTWVMRRGDRVGRASSAGEDAIEVGHGRCDVGRCSGFEARVRADGGGVRGVCDAWRTVTLELLRRRRAIVAVALLQRLDERLSVHLLFDRGHRRSRRSAKIRSGQGGGGNAKIHGRG